MTDVHSDSHIICCFEDVQHHLEEMGISSVIRNEKIIFNILSYGNFVIKYEVDCEVFCQVDKHDIMIDHSYSGWISIPYPQQDMCLFLDSILSYYLDALERVENAK